MADEIAQVCQLEIEGAKIVLKGSVKVIAWLAQALKALMEKGATKITEHKGEKSMKDIWKLSKDAPPQVIVIDDADLKNVLSAAEKAGLRWCPVPDLNANDGKTPICIPPQDAGLFSAIVQRYLTDDITESQKILNSYNADIAELKEKLLHASPEKRNEIRSKIENIEQARDELSAILDDKKNSLEKGCTLSFQDYLSSGAGTEFEKDPEKAMAEYEKGVDIAPSFSAVECMQPIRNKALMPDSKIRFYVPEIGVSITREFKIEDGVVYSNYSFKTEKGEMFEFTDKGKTKEEWNSAILPEMLDKAGILEDTKCRVFDSKERLEAYSKYFNNVLLNSEVKLTEEGKLVFSSAEVENEIRTSVNDMLKSMASAKVDENQVELVIPPEKLVAKRGKINVIVNENTTFVLKNVKPGPKQYDGNYNISISKDSMVTIQEKSKPAKKVSAEIASKELHLARQMAVANFSTAHKR